MTALARPIAGVHDVCRYTHVFSVTCTSEPSSTGVTCDCEPPLLRLLPAAVGTDSPRPRCRCSSTAEPLSERPVHLPALLGIRRLPSPTTVPGLLPHCPATPPPALKHVCTDPGCTAVKSSPTKRAVTRQEDVRLGQHILGMARR